MIMKKHNKLAIILFASIFLAGCANTSASTSPSTDVSGSTSSTTEEVVHAKSVSLNKSVLALEVGETATLKATVLPKNATNKNVTFSIENSNVASIDQNGLVTALSLGTTKATVTTEDGGLSKSITVGVVEEKTVSKTELTYTYEDYTTHNIYALDNCPNVGNPKLLVIPVWFNDSSQFIDFSKKESVRSDIEKVYFGSNEDTGWRSVKTYYEELSGGKVSLTGTVTSWYSVNESYEVYGSDETTTDEEGNIDSKTTTLVTDATNWYFNNNPTEKRTDYDTNADGYLDGVMLIYAAPDYSTLKDKSLSNLWAYCFWLQRDDADVTSPNPDVFFWASYDFMYSDSLAETKTGKKYGAGDTSHCNLDTHTYIHEMGHVFGLSDYYDYSGQYNPAGGFSMQDYNVGSHDPYSAMALGWADPYIPTESCEITLNTFQESKELILLTPSWNSDDSPFDEYFLLELYSGTGLNKFDTDYKYNSLYPRGSNTVGIRLWHVDARLLYINDFDDETEEFSESKMTTNPTTGAGVYHAMSNTYYAEGLEGYYSYLGEEYCDYNLLQLIRNSTAASYTSTDYFSGSILFKQGESFSMETFSNQFVNGTKLNSNKDFGWSFTVKSIENNQAKIALVKE